MSCVRLTQDHVLGFQVPAYLMTSPPAPQRGGKVICHFYNTLMASHCCLLILLRQTSQKNLSDITVFSYIQYILNEVLNLFFKGRMKKSSFPEKASK